MAGRKLVMGDIHGNLQAFRQCMERSAFYVSKDTLIQLGDVSDRHQNTVEVVEALIDIPSLIALRGNHDLWTGEWLETGTADMAWLENGGFATFESYKRNTDSVDIEKHKEFYRDTQLDFYIDSDKNLFVHAGYTHLKGPEHETDPAICYWDRSLWRNALADKGKLMKPHILTSFKEIYIGHTPTLNWENDTPMKAFNIWNLDTGAGTTGKLTIMDIATKEYWQSD